MEDDSGLGCLAGLLFILVILYLIVKAIIMLLTALVIAVMVLVGVALLIAVFLGAGVGVNLLVRFGISLIVERRELAVTTRTVRWGLAAVYGAPWVLLLVGIPAVAIHGSLGPLVWLGCLLLSMPAYYWTWWKGHLPSFAIPLNGSLQPATNTPEIQFSVPFQFDISMQAEERILYAELRARQILGGHELRLWMHDIQIRVKEWWRTFSEEVSHGHF